MSATLLAQLPSGGASRPADAGQQFKQILAYVPTEAVTTYVALMALVSNPDIFKDNPAQKTLVELWFFWGCLVIAALLIFVANKASSTQRPLPTLIWRAFAAALSFFVWTLALKNPTPLGDPSELTQVLGAAGVIFVPILLQIVGVFIDGSAPPAAAAAPVAPPAPPNPNPPGP